MNVYKLSSLIFSILLIGFETSLWFAGSKGKSILGPKRSSILFEAIEF